jgi:hypothetical protein
MNTLFHATGSLLLVSAMLGASIVSEASQVQKAPPSASPMPAARSVGATPKPASSSTHAPKTSIPTVPSRMTISPRAFPHPATSNLREVKRTDGSQVRVRPDGHLADLHVPSRGIDIHHGIAGDRQVRLDRPDHSRVLYDPGRPGYVQHPYAFHGHDFARRTYVYNGHVYGRFYHGYSYRGAYIHVYAPDRFYRPAFYGWAYHPWERPVAFSWGFGGAPWYGYYGFYFTPAPAYATPALWLTDYMLAQNLQASYAAQAQQGVPPAITPGDPATAASSLTPEVKEQIAEEVRSEIALENQEAQKNAAHLDIDPGSSGIDRMLNDGHMHTLVVSSAVDAEDASQNGCTLSEGDVLSLHPPTPNNATTAKLVVLSSKGGRECRPNTTITVVMADLQEMQNRMREHIDQGLQQLQANQGKNGIPSLPESAQGAPTQAAYAEIAPPEDPNAAAQIQQQADEAEKAASPGGQR